MDSGGNWLIAANQDSDALSVFFQGCSIEAIEFYIRNMPPVCVRMYDPVNKS